MRINNVRDSVYSDATAPGKRLESTESTAQGLLNGLTSLSETSSSTSNTALREILAEYDVADITPARILRDAPKNAQKRHHLRRRIQGP